MTKKSLFLLFNFLIKYINPIFDPAMLNYVVSFNNRILVVDAVSVRVIFLRVLILKGPRSHLHAI